jgi:hypothetical protein
MAVFSNDASLSKETGVEKGVQSGGSGFRLSGDWSRRWSAAGVQPLQQPGMAFVPDWQLGEDAPRNAAARLEQEARWAGTNIDARQAFSVREATQLYRPAILDAQDDFYVMRTLVEAQQCSGARCPLSKRSPDLLALVADLAVMLRPLSSYACGYGL